jgi:hypothetical protein
MTRFGGVARAALAVMIVVTIAACSDADDDSASGGGSSKDRETYVDALAGALDDPALDADARQCFAASLVDTIGVGTLADKVDVDEIDADFSPTDFGIEIDQEQGDQFYDRLSDCVDVRALFIGSLSAGQELPEATLACLEDNIDDDLVKRIIVASFTQGAAAADDPELASEMNAISTECAPTAAAGAGAPGAADPAATAGA